MLEAISRFLPKLGCKSKKSVAYGSVEGNRAHSCKVVLLDGSNLFLDIKLSEKGQIVVNQVCQKTGLYEKEFFGLRFCDENGIQKWLKLSKSINSQISGPGPHSFYFSVRFYPANPGRITTEIARYQIYLQIKRDIIHGVLPLPADMAATFAALAVQAEVGEVDTGRMDPDTLSDVLCFKPDGEQVEEFKKRVDAEHEKFLGKSTGRCEFAFLEHATWLDCYGAEFHSVLSNHGEQLKIGILPTGLALFKNDAKLVVYFWPRLMKVSYRNKKVIIRVIESSGEEEEVVFECASKESCKVLYKNCIAHHTFFKLTSTSIVNNGVYQHQGLAGSMSGSTLLSFGSKVFGKKEKKDEPQMIPDVVSSQHHVRSYQRRQRKPSGSESCPERFVGMPRPNSCGVITLPVGHNREYESMADSPRTYRSSHWETNQMDRRYGQSSPVSTFSEYVHQQSHPRRDGGAGECLSDSDSDSVVLQPVLDSRRFQRNNPIYMTSVAVKRTSSRQHRHRQADEMSFYSEVERDDMRHRCGRNNHHHSHKHRRRFPDDEDCNSRCGHGDRYFGRDDRRHVYDRLVDDRGDDGLISAGKEMKIRWADEQGNCHTSRDKPTRHQSVSRRRCRRRSHSPGAGMKPPQELAHHFRYVDPNEEGLTDDQIKDIPYVRVETQVGRGRERYSPRTKQKIRLNRRLEQSGQASDIDCHARLPDGEAPPPYLGDQVGSTSTSNLQRFVNESPNNNSSPSGSPPAIEGTEDLVPAGFEGFQVVGYLDHGGKEHFGYLPADRRQILKPLFKPGPLKSAAGPLWHEMVEKLKASGGEWNYDDDDDFN